MIDLKIGKSKKDQLMQDKEYQRIVKDILENEKVMELKNFPHHGNIDSLSHCIHVSYTSYRIGLKLNLNTNALARGALLHDFYLYDWHIKGERKGLHGFTHPHTALQNATENFTLSPIEKDIIAKHMWPLTIKLPKYKESFVVMIADKYCAIEETLSRNK
jgi:uncharacterized protein